MVRLEELDEDVKKDIVEFEKRFKRKAIWKGRFTYRFLGWRNAPICDECGKKTRFIYALSDACLTKRNSLNWVCDNCNLGFTMPYSKFNREIK